MQSRVGYYLEQLGMKPAELARRAGISKSHVSGIARGTDRASAEVLGRIAQALGVTVDDLLTSRVPVSRQEQQASAAGRRQRTRTFWATDQLAASS